MSKHYDLQDLVTERDLNEEIAKIAYELYKKRETGDGSEFDDWLKAEKVVLERYENLKKNEIDVMSKVAGEKAARRVAKKQKKTQ
jgi:hypothetical protein